MDYQALKAEVEHWFTHWTCVGAPAGRGARACVWV